MIHGSPNLTEMFDAATVEKMKHARKGMAHWGGTGPEGRTCIECAHWKVKLPKRPTTPLRPDTRKATCEKYVSLLNLPRGSRFPGSSPACRYFEERAPTEENADGA